MYVDIQLYLAFVVLSHFHKAIVQIHRTRSCKLVQKAMTRALLSTCICTRSWAVYVLTTSVVFVAHSCGVSMSMMPSVTVCFALTAQFDFVDDTEILSLQLRAYALGTSWFSRHRTIMGIAMSHRKLCRVACLWSKTGRMPGLYQNNSRAQSVSLASIVIPIPM